MYNSCKCERNNKKGREMKHYITENFTYERLVCPCCDSLKIIPQLYDHMEKLQKMRSDLGFSIIVNSGYRCKEHNADISGAKNSQHMQFATDVRPSFRNGFIHRLEAMYKMALKLEFDGIGKYDEWIHLDMRGYIARWKE